MKNLTTIFGSIIFATAILTSCGDSNKQSQSKSKSMICKCMEESAKGSQWYENHEYECLELSSSGQRCNE
jgi:hypothetical protein